MVPGLRQDALATDETATAFAHFRSQGVLYAGRPNRGRLPPLHIFTGFLKCEESHIRS